MKKQFIIMMAGVLMLVGSGQVMAVTQYTITDLGILSGTGSWANSINASGQVVGYANTAAGEFAYRAFLYSGSTMTDLGTLGGRDSAAHGINDSGQIVGWAATHDSYHAFLYSGSTMIDLGAFVYNGDSYAWGINASGQIVGWSNSNYGYRAFLYSGSKMIDLGTLGGTNSFANGINDSGQVVGEADIAAGGPHAFLCSGSTMIDLNTLIDPASDWTLESATAINDSGQIVGYGYRGGQDHAFLLDPVPEPATICLLTLGGIFIYRRRKTV